MRKWHDIDKVPEGVPVRDVNGRLWRRKDGKVWTMNQFGTWYTPDRRPMRLMALREVEGPGWWML